MDTTTSVWNKKESCQTFHVLTRKMASLTQKVPILNERGIEKQRERWCRGHRDASSSLPDLPNLRPSQASPNLLALTSFPRTVPSEGLKIGAGLGRAISSFDHWRVTMLCIQATKKSLQATSGSRAVGWSLWRVSKYWQHSGRTILLGMSASCSD